MSMSCRANRLGVSMICNIAGREWVHGDTHLLFYFMITPISFVFYHMAILMSIV